MPLLITPAFTARPSYECALVDAQYSDLAWVVTMHRREVLNGRHCGAERELQETEAVVYKP